MRAIKINSTTKEIQEIEIDDTDTLSGMQAAVGGYIESAHELDNGDTIYVNEEALLCSPQDFFEVKGGHQPFAGNAIILSHDPDTGESKSAESSLSDIRAAVNFLSLLEVLRQTN